MKNKAELVFCQNPSIVLNSLLCLLKPIFNFKLVVDRHSNFKFYVKDSKALKWRLFHLLSRFTLRKSDLTIVTNQYLKDYIETLGARGFILQDKLPSLDLAKTQQLKGSVNFVFVSTFSEDEPITEMLAVARKLPENYHLYITGNYKKYSAIKSVLADLPANVTLTGFLSEVDYQSLLKSADVVIVITDMEYTLTCGAYEAVSLEKAMVLANTTTIKEYFNKGAIYASPNTTSLTEAVESAAKEINALVSETKILKSELVDDWNERFSALREKVANL
ncbi:MAG: glycosyltransferase [Chitinophagaceae bacterium]|nr:MAG: glycosyltransferase [Chitinophagaceae bacterium]